VKHLRFLENFNQLFNEFDQNSDGRLSEIEFRNLIKKISVIINKDLEIDSLLIKLDPANTQFVNYSGIVFVLSNEFLELSKLELKRSQVDR
jgi:Ca2+-binding EF-hand superfamily protein